MCSWFWGESGSVLKLQKKGPGERREEIFQDRISRDEGVGQESAAFTLKERQRSQELRTGIASAVPAPG